MTDLEKIVSIRDEVHWVNNVPWDQGDQNALHPSVLWDALKKGKLEKGIICGALGGLLQWRLNDEGVYSNLIILSAGTEPHLSHVIVEAQIEEDEWVAIDPYFNCSFSDDLGERLSSLEIKSLLKSGGKPRVCFDGCSLNWLNAWRSWQKSLEWIVKAILEAEDVKLSAQEKIFFKYLVYWAESGRPWPCPYWKKRQYDYWDYFNIAHAQTLDGRILGMKVKR